MATRVQNVGLAIITNRILGSGTEPKYAAMGTGTGQLATATALAVEVETRSGTNTGTQQTTTVANDTYQVVNTVSATGTHAVTEAGLFDASTAGNIFTYADFAAVNLSSGDSVQFTWQVVFS